MSDEIELVKRHLLQKRDRQVQKVLGFGKKVILDQFITDLYALPGNGGSDERRMAREWLERSGHLFNDLASWELHHQAFYGFYVPTRSETDELLKIIKSKSSERSL